MKLRQLHFVKMVAETGSFSRAAALSHATQPTLSNAIGLLEEELGAKLFVRTTRQVSLTAFGAAMLPRIDALIAAERELQQAALAYHNPEEQMLRIGFSPLVDMQRLDQSLASFRDQYPKCGIFFKECLLDDLDQRLQEDVIDLAIVPQATVPGGMAHCVFYSDPLCYLPSHLPDRRQSGRIGGIALGALPDAPLIMTGGGCGLNGSLAALFDQQGCSYNAYRGQAVSYRMIEEWCDLGIGASILPSAKLSLACDQAVPLTLNDGERARFTFHWIWLDQALARPHVADFISCIRQGLSEPWSDGEQASPLQAS